MTRRLRPIATPSAIPTTVAAANVTRIRRRVIPMSSQISVAVTSSANAVAIRASEGTQPSLMNVASCHTPRAIREATANGCACSTSPCDRRPAPVATPSARSTAATYSSAAVESGLASS